MSNANYSTVTELPGAGAHAEQLAILYSRYHFASQYVQGKDVLEIACGGGQGLGYLAQCANRVVGGDIDESCLRFAREHYTDDRPIEILQLDAQDLRFEADSFDTVLLYEAIYYLPDARKFLQEAKRVLRPGGTLLISSVNREWAEFNPSPYSVRYYSAQELVELFEQEGFSARLYGAFPAGAGGVVRRLISLARRVAVRLHLVPKTMKGKRLLKRIFYGKLVPMPHEVTDGMARLEPAVPLVEDGPVTGFKFVYAVGSMPS